MSYSKNELRARIIFATESEDTCKLITRIKHLVDESLTAGSTSIMIEDWRIDDLEDRYLDYPSNHQMKLILDTIFEGCDIQVENDFIEIIWGTMWD
jgi:hypothetical protein